MDLQATPGVYYYATIIPFYMGQASERASERQSRELWRSTKTNYWLVSPNLF